MNSLIDSPLRECSTHRKLRYNDFVIANGNLETKKKPAKSILINSPPIKAETCSACKARGRASRQYMKSGFEILKCGNCGLGWVSGAADFDANAYYTESYFQGTHPDGYADYRGAEPLLRNEFKKTLAHLFKFTNSHQTLLEIGCAYGFFLQEAMESYKCYGIEISQAAAAHCRQNGLEVLQGKLEDHSFENKKFDIAVMLDCIEHLKNPVEAIRLLHGRLNAQGLLLLTTGDYGAWTSRVFGRHWRLMTPPQHLHFFTQISMHHLLQGAGFQILSSDRPWKLVPLQLIAFQLTKRFGFKTPNLAWLKNTGIYINLFDTMRIVARKVDGKTP